MLVHVHLVVLDELLGKLADNLHVELIVTDQQLDLATENSALGVCFVTASFAPLTWSVA